MTIQEYLENLQGVANLVDDMLGANEEYPEEEWEALWEIIKLCKSISDDYKHRLPPES